MSNKSVKFYIAAIRTMAVPPKDHIVQVVIKDDTEIFGLTSGQMTEVDAQKLVKILNAKIK